MTFELLVDGAETAVGCVGADPAAGATFREEHPAIHAVDAIDRAAW